MPKKESNYHQPMSSTSRKRKYHPTPPAYAHRTTSASDPDPDPDINPALFVQAHEADVIRGPEARIAARALEVDGVGGRLVVGDGLIRWGGAEQSKPGRKEVGALLDFEGSSDDDDDGGRDDSDERAVWVDRYALSYIIKFYFLAFEEWERAPFGLSACNYVLFEQRYFMTERDLEGVGKIAVRFYFNLVIIFPLLVFLTPATIQV